MNEESEIEESDLSTSKFISYTDVMRFIWRRKSHVFLGIVVGLVLGALYYVQKAPEYEALAQVLVVQKRPEAVTGQAASMSQFEDYASTHRILLKSPIIVQSAIETCDLGSLESLKNVQNKLLTTITNRLTVSKVSREADSVLQLNYRGSIADECGIVVNAILDSYQKFLADTYQDMSKETLTLITESRDLLQNDLQTKESDYRAFRENAPMIWNGPREVNPSQDRLTIIDSQRSNLLLLKADLEGKRQIIADAKKEGRSEKQLLALISDVSDESFDADTSRNGEETLKTALLPLLLEEKRLLADYGPNHPYVLAVRERIETTRNFFALPTASYVSSMADNPNGEGADTNESKLVDLYVDYLNTEIKRIDASEKVLTDLYEKELQEARKLNSYQIRDEEFRTGITRTQALYDGLIERLQDASLIKDYGGFEAKIIAPAGKGEKVAPRLTYVGAGSVFLGLLFGLGMAYVAELSDRSFRSPDEIRRRLQLPIIGHIPNFREIPENERPDETHHRAGMLCSYFKPRSTESESFRSIRTALYFSAEGEDQKVMQVTSSNPSDGKSTVAANLAISIAMSKKRVLIIDADLRKPTQHKIFDVSSRVGLAAAIGEDIEPSDAIVASGIENLSIMPAGALPPDPAELLTSPKFSELLEVLRQQFDYIIIDSPPLLAVTDPSIVAARADGVLLTIRISKDGRTQAERSKEILNAMDANILGVVVNAVDSNENRGYYAQAYGYGQGDYYGESPELAVEANSQDS